MTPVVDHELTFASRIVSWINQELQTRPELAFGQAAIEQSARGSRKRRDLTVYDRSGKLALTLELKLPYVEDGHSPFNERVVADAHGKAARAGAPFFATWNVNRIALWRTDEEGVPLHQRCLEEWALVQVRDEAGLASPATEEAVRRGLSKFLERASQAYTGVLPLSKRPLDTFFITALEAALERPIAATFVELQRRYPQDTLLKANLDQWMHEIQGWQLSDDQNIRRDIWDRLPGKMELFRFQSQRLDDHGEAQPVLE